MGHGLTRDRCAELAYQCAIENQLSIPRSWHEKKAAGKDWVSSFLKRHPSLSLRKSQGCSMHRASAFNKYNVDLFLINWQQCWSEIPILLMGVDFGI